MRAFISQYQKQFVHLLDSIVASDGAKREQAFDEGIEKACNIIEDQTLRGGKIFFIGNGGSAAIAGHMAIDFWKNG